MEIRSALIVSIVSLQHIFLLTVHPVGALALPLETQARRLIDRSQTNIRNLSSASWGSAPIRSVIRHVDAERASQGNEVVGSDEGLFNAGLFEGDIQVPSQPTHKNAIRDDRLLWPLAAIPYTIDDSIGCPDSWRCALLMDAMEHLHQVSCVRFKEWTGDAHKIHIFLNPERGACWSPVGRTGGASQDVSLGADCWYKGIILHELLHAVGFWHEMNRPDRDYWVDVNWSNILQGFSHAFYKQDEYQVDTLGERFDYRSVMMYDEYAFSKDGVSITLKPRVAKVVIGPIWRKTELSKSDVRRLEKLYSCSGNQDLYGFPTNEVCSFDADTCGFVNAGVSLWRWQRVQSSGFLYMDTESLMGQPALLQSINFHALSSRAEELGCLRFTYFASNEQSVLKAKVVYLNKATDLHFDEWQVLDLWTNRHSGEWVYAEVPLYVHRPFKIIYEASFKDITVRGTVALDDVELYYHPCSNK